MSTREARTIERLRAKIEALKSAWRTSGEDAWCAHVAGYTCRRAIEAAARKHGATLGPRFVELLALRLVEVDVRDDTRPTIETARRLVARWSAEGKTT